VNRLRLGVNIDHVATLREARKTTEPDPVTAAMLAEMGGADQVTFHLREDRRHIQNRDARLICEMAQTMVNLEMAATPEMQEIALAMSPDSATLVPEKREEVTTEGGLNLLRAGRTRRR
jgi:pyridoxine 5-phosphate synthase